MCARNRAESEFCSGGEATRSGNLHRAGIALVLVVAFALRFYGLVWDDGHWLHPDERQIYFLVLNLAWPHSLSEALSPASPLNPHFFAYGSLPIYLLKLVYTLLAPLWPTLRGGDHLHLVARPLVALADLGTVYLTYRLALKVWRTREAEEPPAPQEAAHQPVATGLPRERAVALLAAAFVSLAILHVQLAHFYTADPLLTLAVMLTLNLAADVAQGGDRRYQLGLGIALGLALAIKVSALPLVFVVFVAYYTRGKGSTSQAPSTHGLYTLWRMILPLVVAGAVFFLTQPYALIDWRTFLEDTFREARIARGALDVPYTLQYAGTLPFLYPLWQTALWGLALPLGLAAWAGLVASLLRWLRHGPWADALLLAWAGPYLVVTGLLYTKYLRYTLPLVPVLALMAARLLFVPSRPQRLDTGGHARGRRPSSVVHRLTCILNRSSFLVTLFLLTCSLGYALAFAGIYATPHSWVTASEWIYHNVPARSTLTVEHWDTPLPLPLEVEGTTLSPGQYTYRTLNLYDEPDDAAKWEALSEDLAESDLLILASRRLYASIPRLPDRYPLATRYYDQLFNGELGFELAGEFIRGPAWLNPRLPPLPDAAPAVFHPDESFVVYDHPRALIFRNVERLPAEELLRHLTVER